MIQETANSWVELIQLQLGWYPLMGLRDVYKLLYQGIMGPEHLIASPEEFSRYLAQEYDSLAPDPTGRLIEPIRPDRILLRLNLRPTKARRIQIDRLIPAMLETGKVVAGDLGILLNVWLDFVESCQQGMIINYSLENIRQFHNIVKDKNYPAVHHSKCYRQSYQPAYRIIAAEFLPITGLSDAF